MQHLHSSGPLKYKLSSALKKLQREAEVISELLNIAAEPADTPQVHQSKLVIAYVACLLVHEVSASQGD